MATRVSSSADPRMAVLRDPATLQQLWKGSQRNYRWGGRQPLRRRRGDVHGDLSAVVIRLDWAGGPRSCLMCNNGSSLWRQLHVGSIVVRVLAVSCCSLPAVCYVWSCSGQLVF